MRNSADEATRIWTVGHSTRSAEEFLQVLAAHDIRNLVDVRSFPSSRRYPQFNQEELRDALGKVGVDYHHIPSLGGRRKSVPNSKNTAWRNESFRAYADHMESVEFKSGIAHLLTLARERRSAVMCAEAVWWRCHRGLISDYLKDHGVEVLHIISASKTEPHPYTAAARIIEGKLSYQGLLPAED
jgi:uncharacterized protein (DUF488 family)